MTRRYAAETEVGTDRSMLQIKALLSKHGASGFYFAEQSGDDESPPAVIVGFKALNEAGELVHVKLSVPIPDSRDPDFTQTPTGKVRSEGAARDAWEQACRAVWRLLHLGVKAKLELIAGGVSTIEREFYPDIVLHTGKTISQTIGEDIAQLTAGGAKIKGLLA